MIDLDLLRACIAIALLVLTVALVGVSLALLVILDRRSKTGPRRRPNP